MISGKAITRGLPPPIGGFVTSVNLDAMKEYEAVTLENVFPGSEDCYFRKGFSVQATGLGSGVVDTLIEYPMVDGTLDLIACANGKIYDATTIGAAATQLATGFSNNQWQHVIYKNTLILVNGTDQPQQYNGTAVSAANYTGIADDAVFVAGAVYKQRLYFVKKNSTSVFYAGVGSITGAVTEFDVGDVLKKGGAISFIGHWSNDTGDGLEDIFIIASDQGELLLYTGLYPADSTWSLVSRFYLAKPLGRRAATNLLADMLIITREGILPLSAVLSSRSRIGELEFATDRIQPTFRKATDGYGGNFGWTSVYYPKAEYFLVNVPTSASTSYQLVMNSKTGAWCKFTGMNARCWCVFDNKLYFGGMDGKVYRADNTYNDNGNFIETKIKWAYNYFGDRRHQKRFLAIKPIVFGDAAVNFTVGVDVDLGTRAINNIVSVTGSPGTPWGSPWGSAWGGAKSLKRSWYSVNGRGFCGALRMEASVKNVIATISGVHVAYETGGIL